MKLRPLFLATTAITCVGLPAFANDADIWAGFYGGLGLVVTATGEIEEQGNWYDMDSRPDQPFELFGGYNWVSNQMVYGLELAGGSSKYWEEDSPDYGLEDVIDIRARAGVAKGKWLYYGFVAASFAEYYNGAPDTKASTDGFGLGVGASYAVTDNIFIGGEIAHRKLSANEDLSNTKKGKDGWNDNGGKFTTLSVRVGYLF